MSDSDWGERVKKAKDAFPFRPLIDKDYGGVDPISEYQYTAGNVNPKDLAGANKPQLGLIPVGALNSVARVMELGAKKYGPYNWRSKPVRYMVYANAALRHLIAWIGGETNDPESGQPHWAHVVACGLIVLDAMSLDVGVDDRDWAAIPPGSQDKPKYVV